MACKTTKKEQNPKDVLAALVSRSMEVISDLTLATTTASTDATLESARRLVKFQKMSAKTGLGLIAKVHGFTEKTLKQSVKEGKWIPKEGKEVVDEWSHMMKSGVDEFGRVIEKSFDLVLKYIDRVEKEHKTAARKPAAAKPAPAKAAVKKAPAKKKAAAKTAAAKKAPAKKKSAAATPSAE